MQKALLATAIFTAIAITAATPAVAHGPGGCHYHADQGRDICHGARENQPVICIRNSNNDNCGYWEMYWCEYQAREEQKNGFPEAECYRK